ncbi:MAG: phosphopantetheine-binding protein [Proteobacteria bacterium]|nr:phosphopantetheine-binding protein [Pseudomonadota bacterium]
MSIEQVESLIAELVQRILAERGQQAGPVNSQTRLLGGELDIDSLDLAAVVVELETRLGKDPFAGGFIEFRTVGELAALYVG